MRKLPDHVSREHPIVTGRYAIFTPAIAACADKLGGWLDNKISGAYIYGPSRFGKTRAVQFFLKNLLEERLGSSLPLHVWIRPITFASAGEFYKSLLESVSHAYRKGRLSPTDRLIMLREFFLASADNCGTTTVVLIIDEAQGMTTKEWLWLLSLQNLMDQAGYVLSVFSIATHQMAYEFDLLARTGNPHVAARFLVDQWKFPGVESEEELGFILDGYDEQSRWPVEGGVSYLEHFAPIDFSQRKRLSNVSTSMWRALVALLPSDHEGAISFPMKHVALAVEDVLFHLGFGADWDEVTSEKAWVDFLTTHRLADHMRAIALDV